MDNEYGYTPEQPQQETPVQPEPQQQAYTDPYTNTNYEPNNQQPNAGYQQNNAYNYGGDNNYQQNAGYQANNGYQQNNYQSSGGYQPNNNYNYANTGYQPTGGQGMDESPLSMGQWVLTILASMIPCAGLILYFVWAFSKNGNLNRRNYCRAMLIIEGVVIALYVVILIIAVAAGAGAASYYY